MLLRSPGIRGSTLRMRGTLCFHPSACLSLWASLAVCLCQSLFLPLLSFCLCPLSSSLWILLFPSSSSHFRFSFRLFSFPLLFLYISSLHFFCFFFSDHCQNSHSTSPKGLLVLVKWGFELGWGWVGIRAAFGLSIYSTLNTQATGVSRGLWCLWPCRQLGTVGGRGRGCQESGEGSEGPSCWGLGREGSWPKQ